MSEPQRLRPFTDDGDRWSVERERCEQVLTYPKWTLLRIGWLTPSGNVQGSIHYRIGDGLGPTTRDTRPADELRRAVMRRDPAAIEVLATP